MAICGSVGVATVWANLSSSNRSRNRPGAAQPTRKPAASVLEKLEQYSTLPVRSKLLAARGRDGPK